jgi:hypothetical protein
MHARDNQSSAVLLPLRESRARGTLKPPIPQPSAAEAPARTSASRESRPHTPQHAATSQQPPPTPARPPALRPKLKTPRVPASTYPQNTAIVNPPSNRGSEDLCSPDQSPVSSVQRRRTKEKELAAPPDRNNICYCSTAQGSTKV